MAGAGTVGTGGLGVGGWQIYEEVNPTFHRQLSKEGYSWKPIEVPLQDEVPTSNTQFNWKKWGCVEKLFPTLKDQIKPESVATSTSSSQPQMTLGGRLYPPP